MDVKVILKELNKCDQLKCQGCKLNIKVLHGFDCAAHFCYIDSWKDMLYRLLIRYQKNIKCNMLIKAINIHEKFKGRCVKCPLYNGKYSKCELENFQKRQTILRLMRSE